MSMHSALGSPPMPQRPRQGSRAEGFGPEALHTARWVLLSDGIRSYRLLCFLLKGCDGGFVGSPLTLWLKR